MRILLLTHSFNSLSQRLFGLLRAQGHAVSVVELDIADSVTEEAVALFQPTWCWRLSSNAASRKRWVAHRVPGGAPRRAGRPGPQRVGLDAHARRRALGRDRAAGRARL